jgi:hypothetical protein
MNYSHEAETARQNIEATRGRDQRDELDTELEGPAG